MFRSYPTDSLNRFIKELVRPIANEETVYSRIRSGYSKKAPSYEFARNDPNKHRTFVPDVSQTTRRLTKST